MNIKITDYNYDPNWGHWFELQYEENEEIDDAEACQLFSDVIDRFGPYDPKEERWRMRHTNSGFELWL